jgi:MFS transporter, PAT family, beta-lactamase induction signal transducer AmpG
MSDSAITRDTAGRFVLLGTLYFAQGLPYGFFSLALPILLRQSGVSLSKIALTSLLALPWALKFLWAPVVDRVYSRRFGRRRTWILAMQLSATLVLGAMAIVASDNMVVLMAGSFLLNCIAATQDIATDGLAVELLPPEERGFANGLQVAAYRIGMVVSGGVLLGAYAELGQRGLFAIMSGLTVLSTLPVVFAAEPPTVTAEKPLVPDVHFLSLPGAWQVIALVVAYKFGDEAAKGMLRLFLVDRHLEIKDIAFIVGTVGVIAGMAGAILGGILVGVIGRKRALLLFGAAQTITVLGYAYLAVATPTYYELYVWSGFEHLASGMATAALFTAMMDWCRPQYSGTDYTVQASAVVIATGTAATVSGMSADALGYGGHFIVCAAVSALALVVVAKLFPTRFPRETVPTAQVIIPTARVID